MVAQLPDAEAERLAAENEALRSERDELLARVGPGGGATGESSVVRRMVVGVVVVVAVLSTLFAGSGILARRNLLDTDRWVSRVGPLAEDPLLQAALSARLTDEVAQLIDVESLFEEVLPERGQRLAVPLSNAVEGFIGDRVTTFIESPDFAGLWVAANRLVHEDAVRVLRDESETVAAGDETVTINLLPIINEVLAQIGERSPELLGREVDLPTLSAEDLPEPAIRVIERRLGVDLGVDFGQLTVYDGGRLAAAQQALQTIDRAVEVLAVVAVLSTVAALWLSRTRRRTLLQLVVGVAIGLVILRRVTFRLEDDVVALVRVDENRPAVEVVVAAFTDPLLTNTQWLLVAAAATIVVIVLTSSVRWAVALRRRASDLVRAGARSIGVAGGRARDDDTTRWLVEHRGVLQAAVVVTGVAALWFFHLSWLGFLVVLTIVAGLELVLSRVEVARA